MVCACCDFYVPKNSTRGQWLQTRDGLFNMLQEIPPPSKTKQHTSQPSIIAVEQVLLFQAHQGKKESVR